MRSRKPRPICRSRRALLSSCTAPYRCAPASVAPTDGGSRVPRIPPRATAPYGILTSPPDAPGASPTMQVDANTRGRAFCLSIPPLARKARGLAAGRTPDARPKTATTSPGRANAPQRWPRRTRTPFFALVIRLRWLYKPSHMPVNTCICATVGVTKVLHNPQNQQYSELLNLARLVPHYMTCAPCFVLSFNFV
jgi:hypothetical protein